MVGVGLALHLAAEVAGELHVFLMRRVEGQRRVPDCRTDPVRPIRRHVSTISRVNRS